MRRVLVCIAVFVTALTATPAATAMPTATSPAATPPAPTAATATPTATPSPAATATPAASATPAAGSDAASGAAERVVVTFAAGTSASERAAALVDPAGTGPVPDAATSAVPDRGINGVVDRGISAMSVGAAPPVAVVHAAPAQRRALERDHRVLRVDEDVPTRADAIVVEDPLWPAQHGVRRIRANDVWPESTGDDDVVIAVIDTGVDPATRDLAGRLLPGYDFVNRDDDPRDDNGHGTAVATIAAASSDRFGVAGVCWRCRVMPIKVLDASGNGFLSDAALGIAWAVEQGADVVNVSLGAGGTMPVLEDALDAARKAGVLVVASAGNAGTSQPQWPAADPRVVGVAALDAMDRRATYSNHGQWVEVAAPGCNPSGWLANSTMSFCGTSSATPLVSGSAALLAAARNATTTQIRAAMRDTAVAAGSGVGAGRIDVLGALRRLPAFADITGSVHAANIEVLAAAGITTGCGPTRYCPTRPVTRGQIATFLDRALDLPEGTQAFADVPADHPHAGAIAAAAHAGIVMGCGGSRYCPSDDLTRGQMATLLQRALRLPDGTPRFDDVDGTYAHAQGIWAIAAEGITTGCDPRRFCPAGAVTRGQMASFLVRAMDL